MIMNIANGEKSIAKVSKSSFDNLSQMKAISFYREVDILLKINHPSISKCLGYSLINFKNKPHPVIIMKLLYMNTIKISDTQATQKIIFLFGIASAMTYLHSHNILYRNLNLENITTDQFNCPKIKNFENSIEIQCSSEKVKDSRLKGEIQYLAPEVLKDLEYSKSSDVYSFGVPKFIKNKTSEISNKIKGTPVYLAPEVYEKKEYSKSSDVYAFSYIMYELFTGKRAFEIKREIVENQTRPTFNDKPIEKVYRELIERCWSQDPKSRPTFDEIVHELKTNSDFLTEEIDKEYYQYIKFIDEFPVTFDDTKNVVPYDFDILIQKFKFQEEGSIINIGDIYKTEYNNIIFDYDFVNINNYKKQKLIRASQEFKMYEIINETKEKFFAIRITDHMLTVVQKLLIKVIKNNFMINHPSFLNVIGFSPFSFKNKQIPTFITEYASNG